MGTALTREQDAFFKRLATSAARAADDKKGEDITLLHTRPVTALTDYMLLVSVLSPNHLDAVEEGIRKSLKELGLGAQHRDGRQSDRWRVLDYGGLLIHLMHPATRVFYALDKAFHRARKVRWNHRARRTGRAPARPRRRAASRGSAKRKTVRRKRG